GAKPGPWSLAPHCQDADTSSMLMTSPRECAGSKEAAGNAGRSPARGGGRDEIRHDVAVGRARVAGALDERPALHAHDLRAAARTLARGCACVLPRAARSGIKGAGSARAGLDALRHDAARPRPAGASAGA